jgi:cell division protein FtsB
MPVPDQLRLPATTDATEPAPARRPRIRQRLRTPLEARQWRRKIAGYALAGMSFVFIVNALVGENGYLSSMRAERDRRELASQLQELRDDNERMRDEIHRLRTDPQELEDAARGLHMTKPGEKVIILKEPAKSPTAK